MVIFEAHIVQQFIQGCLFFFPQWPGFWSGRGFRVLSPKPIVCRGLEYWLMILLSGKDRGQSHSWRFSLWQCFCDSVGTAWVAKRGHCVCVCSQLKSCLVRLFQLLVKQDIKWLYCKTCAPTDANWIMKTLLIQKYSPQCNFAPPHCHAPR